MYYNSLKLIISPVWISENKISKPEGNELDLAVY